MVMLISMCAETMKPTWGLRIAHAGIDPGITVVVPGLLDCRGMEAFLVRGCDGILPGCGETSTLSRGATLRACWLHGPQSTSDQPMGMG